MKPTTEQLKAIRDAAAARVMDASEAFSRAFASEMIEAWEAIRPKDDEIKDLQHKLEMIQDNWSSARPLIDYVQNSDLGQAGECAFDVALRGLEGLAAAKLDNAQLIAHADKQLKGMGSMAAEITRLKAMLPEWIPVSERKPTADDAEGPYSILYRDNDGDLYFGGWYQAYPHLHWLPSSALANLPKREHAPKPEPEPTAEEIMRHQPNERISGSEGMSLRDYFAGQVLAGTDITEHAAGVVAAWAYETADAMIAARKGDS